MKQRLWKMQYVTVQKTGGKYYILSAWWDFVIIEENMYLSCDDEKLKQ